MTSQLVQPSTRKREIYPRAAAIGGGLSQQTSLVPARILSFEFWRSYVITMRPYLLFVSGITGIAGMSLVAEISATDSLLLSLVFFLAYGFGQALTDCFQTDTDSLSSPYRPLVQGKVRQKDVLAVSLVGLIVGGMILGLYNTVNLPLVFLGIVGLATYTPFKRRWWSGPLYNAWIVAVLCLIGYSSAVGATASKFAGSPVLVLTLFTVLFGYANFVLAGYYKDISADRTTGYRTMPVAFGLKVSSVVSDIFALLTLAAFGATLYFTLNGSHLGIEQGPAFLFASAGVASTALAQIRLHRVRSETEAHWAIGPVVQAYVLLLSAIVVAQEPSWSPAIVLFYVGFLLTLKLRPMKQQI